MSWWIVHDRSTGRAVSETDRDPTGRRLDPSLAVYAVPEELLGPNGERAWTETHEWAPASKSLVPKPPEVKSQDRLDAERILGAGITNDADRDRLLLLLAGQVLRPDRM